MHRVLRELQFIDLVNRLLRQRSEADKQKARSRRAGWGVGCL